MTTDYWTQTASPPTAPGARSAAWHAGRGRARGLRGGAARAAARRLLEGPLRPDAVFGVYELPAIAVLRRAAELGINVPGELMVAGPSDFGLGRQSTPPMTTLEYDAKEHAREAAEMLVAPGARRARRRAAPPAPGRARRARVDARARAARRSARLSAAVRPANGPAANTGRPPNSVSSTAASWILLGGQLEDVLGEHDEVGGLADLERPGLVLEEVREGAVDRVALDHLADGHRFFRPQLASSSGDARVAAQDAALDAGSGSGGGDTG